MPGSDDSRSDYALSDALSARSYLELAQGYHAQSKITPPQSNDYSASGEPIELEGKGNSGPRLPSRTTRTSLRKAKGPEKPETAHEITDPHPVERLTRKRGRPRLETAKDAAAIEVL